jgi:DNA-binding GntR family transcriptional regulator
MTSAIQAGATRGSRLPSTRVLARLLGISRNTVMAAYDDLVASGLVSGRRGAGMLVAAGPSRGVHAFDLRHVLRQAQYPTRTIGVADPDGNQLYMSIR